MYARLKQHLAFPFPRAARTKTGEGQHRNKTHFEEDMSRELELVIYSDVACAWCYIGWRRLRTALESDKMKQYKFTLKPSFRPFLINENLDENPVTKEQLFETKFMGGDNASAVRNKISSEGEKEGIKFNWDKNAKVRQTKAAHRVLERAYETGGFALQSKLADKLYTAFHSDAIDVGEPTELAKIASSEPDFMSYDDALKFVQSDEGSYELDKALEKCKHYGIDSVPFFILDETESITEAISVEEWHKRFGVLARAYGLAD